MNPKRWAAWLAQGAGRRGEDEGEGRGGGRGEGGFLSSCTPGHALCNPSPSMTNESQTLNLYIYIYTYSYRSEAVSK